MARKTAIAGYGLESEERSDDMVSRYQRVAVLVDVQNMFYSAKHQYRAKLNFAKLLDGAVQGRQLIRAIAYIVQTPDIDQTNFINMLQQTGYEVKSKRLRLRPDGTAKGDWDMGMAIDAISLADRLDSLVLVSGDGDFVDLVNMLKGRGVRVEVLSFPYSTAEELRQAATFFTPIGPDMLLAGSHFQGSAHAGANGHGSSSGANGYGGQSSPSRAASMAQVGGPERQAEGARLEALPEGAS
jgi:uncharacterized LabA/DUF88 family protein